MEAKALNRFITTSPRKMRIVVDLIRGKKVNEALSILHFSSKHSSKIIEKTLRSAISNFQNKSEGTHIDNENIYIKEAFVNGGPSMKRIMPAPMGRAYRVRKRSNHLTLIVADKTSEKTEASKNRQVKKPIKNTEKGN